MKVIIDAAGYLTAHGDGLSGPTVISFDGDEPTSPHSFDVELELPPGATRAFRVTGEAPNRVLLQRLPNGSIWQLATETAAAPSGASVDSWLHAYVTSHPYDPGDSYTTQSTWGALGLTGQIYLQWDITSVVGNGSDVEVLADLDAGTGRTIQFNTDGRYDLMVTPAIDCGADGPTGAKGSLGLVVRTVTSIPMLNLLAGALDTVFSGGNEAKVMQPLWLPDIPVAAGDQLWFQLNGSIVDEGTPFLLNGTDLYVRRVA